ncbi:MAG: hypothetical protein JSS60_00190 [Verrucomicrobia bacterium]|nr:hypothetical protein [Verrucomicrobiota bacterium]
MLPSPFPIRISSPKTEGILQVSKWLKIQVLLDTDEMNDLLKALGEVAFVVVSEPVEPQDAVISAGSFLAKYADYIHLLKQGEVPPADDFRRFFSSALSTTLDTFYAIAAGGNKFLIKPLKPVVQLQAHHFFYSDLDRKFHPMVLSAESVSWGVQFSYPQLFQDPKTRQIVKVADTPEFPNSALFSTLMKWMRSATLPTPFEVGSTRVNSPIRVGKKSLSWIKSHPQLQMKGIQVSQIRSP